MKIKSILTNDKISKSVYTGILNLSTHLFTKGKRTEDINESIDILSNKIIELNEILNKRKQK